MTPQPPRRHRRTPRANRFSATSLLLITLLLGLIGGLVYAWVIDPVIYVAAGPARLGAAEQADYLLLVSESYAIDGNWELAQQRLAALQDPVLTNTVAALLDDWVRQQRDPAQITNLATLARQIGVQTQAVALFAPTPAGVLPSPTPQPTRTAAPANETPNVTATPMPSPTWTPSPTTAVSPTPRPNYRLLDQERVCLEDGDHLLIEVEVFDALLDPQPGTEIIVTWGSSEDHFFTGFKPAQGLEYADFEMTPDISYTVQLADGSPEVSGLRLESCDSGFLGGWRLTYQNLRVAGGE